jgi:hypothetical protein
VFGFVLTFALRYVGSCVYPENEERSEEELRRETGCTEALPVPCHGKCTATFVHCLRDLHERQMMGEDVSIPEKEKSPDNVFEAVADRWKGGGKKSKRRHKSENPDEETEKSRQKKKKKKATKKLFKRSNQIKRVE